jgi:hypothetical protein
LGHLLPQNTHFGGKKNYEVKRLQGCSTPEIMVVHKIFSVRNGKKL